LENYKRTKIYNIIDEGLDGLEEWKPIVIHDILTDYIVSTYGRVANKNTGKISNR
jgi:hypothetical protein